MKEIMLIKFIICLNQVCYCDVHYILSVLELGSALLFKINFNL